MLKILHIIPRLNKGGAERLKLQVFGFNNCGLCRIFLGVGMYLANLC